MVTEPEEFEPSRGRVGVKGLLTCCEEHSGNSASNQGRPLSAFSGLYVSEVTLSSRSILCGSRSVRTKRCFFFFFSGGREFRPARFGGCRVLIPTTEAMVVKHIVSPKNPASSTPAGTSPARLEGAPQRNPTASLVPFEGLWRLCASFRSRPSPPTRVGGT